MNQTSSILVFCILLQVVNCSELFQIIPNVTDSNINSYLDPYYVYVPEANKDSTLKDEIFVFLPGTYANPEQYSVILSTHASFGFRTIGLSYHNAPTVGDLCTGTNPEGTCFSDVRIEIITGQNTTDKVVVNYSNSIYNRIYKLLLYLNSTQPSNNWGKFISYNSVKWDNIIISGHSQGAGHAAYIGLLQSVKRVVQYDGITDVYSNGQVPSWISSPKRTPVSSFFGFKNKYEYICEAVTNNWKAIGMHSFGDTVDIEKHHSPFYQSRSVCSTYIPKIPASSPVGIGMITHLTGTQDAYLSPETIKRYTPVWKYLVTIGDCGNCTSGTFCGTNDECILPNDVYWDFQANCKCESRPLINPTFIIIVVLASFLFLTGVIIITLACICKYRPSCCVCWCQRCWHKGDETRRLLIDVNKTS